MSEMYKQIKKIFTIKPEYCVNYINAWILNKYIFIQTDYCFLNLMNIISEKSILFSNTNIQAMVCIDYVISYELMRQYLQLVHELHDKYADPTDGLVVHAPILPQYILVDYDGKY